MLESKSKAQILKWVSPKLKNFIVPDLSIFTVKCLRKDIDAIISSVQNQFGDKKLVIRSSSLREDLGSWSSAGAYESVLGVPASDRDAIAQAMRLVQDSYQRTHEISDDDEVFVQEMVTAVSMSGVIFTHDHNTGAPYYVVNYDDESGLTNTVTAGEGDYSNRTLYIHRGRVEAIKSPRFERLICAVSELERILDCRYLDIEFALNADFVPYLLQVRKITTQGNWAESIGEQVSECLNRSTKTIKKRFSPITGVYGKTTVFGQMPDWNPAEMIGRAPRRLALTLYSKLITDSAWRVSRGRMGYHIPGHEPLMVSIAGQPFIDVRLSLNSFLPSDLSPEICGRLVEAGIERLRRHPELHDKIEFEVFITAFSFDIEEKLNRLFHGVLTEDEMCHVISKYKDLTFPLLRGEGVGSIESALRDLERLAERQISHHNDVLSTKRFAEIISDCIHFGTIPFATLARHAFIGKTLLLSLEKCGVLNISEISVIERSFKTIATELVEDFHKLHTGNITADSFLRRYGHLRPGTYDILSSRYDQMHNIIPDVGFRSASIEPFSYSLTDDQLDQITALLKANDLDDFSPDKLFDYIRSATVSREYAKFVFTKTVSDLLESISLLGESVGLSREQLSHLSINDLLSLEGSDINSNIRQKLTLISEKASSEHAVSSAIRLPQILSEEADLHVIPFQVSVPNFITTKTVSAQVVVLDSSSKIQDIRGKIVLIENADPGFDWIFAHRISGLITKYGGTNSHMAIRCAEFGLPAAIGCGEQRFEAFRQSNTLCLDCAAGLILVTN
jgi:phosphohistidine swiveling domain-containing protein